MGGGASTGHMVQPGHPEAEIPLAPWPGVGAGCLSVPMALWRCQSLPGLLGEARCLLANYGQLCNP